MSHPSQAATAVPAGPPACLDAAPPLAGKRRGNPDLGLAPRCGARTRGGCPCRAPAIHGKSRCRMHGGRSTGPRTEAGMARLRSARTVHGAYSAETRAHNRHDLSALRRGQVGNAAVRNVDRLPPDLAARLWQMPGELLPPPWPTGGLTPAEDRAVLRTEAEALAPWRQAIEQAAPAKRAGRAAADAGGSGAGAKAHAPVLPRTGPAAAPGAADGVSPDCATKAHAPECASDMDAAALAASLATLAATQARAHVPEPAADRRGVSPVAAHATAGGPIQPPAKAHAPEGAGDTGEAALAASPGASLAAQARAHAPEPATDRSGVSPGAATAMAGGRVQPPVKAHAPESGPAASDAAPAALLNRATRRRWKRLQRLHRGSGTAHRSLSPSWPSPSACPGD
jgi:hypothetical protein